MFSFPHAFNLISDKEIVLFVPSGIELVNRERENFPFRNLIVIARIETSVCSVYMSCCYIRLRCHHMRVKLNPLEVLLVELELVPNRKLFERIRVAKHLHVYIIYIIQAGISLYCKHGSEALATPYWLKYTLKKALANFAFHERERERSPTLEIFIHSLTLSIHLFLHLFVYSFLHNGQNVM